MRDDDEAVGLRQRREGVGQGGKIRVVLRRVGGGIGGVWGGGFRSIQSLTTYSLSLRTVDPEVAGSSPVTLVFAFRRVASRTFISFRSVRVTGDMSCRLRAGQT